MICWGEVESIMWSISPLPHLPTYDRGCGEDPTLCEKGSGSRTQSTERVSVPVFVGKLSEKLTAALSDSDELSGGKDKPVGVYYEPRAFEELPELEVIA